MPSWWVGLSRADLDAVAARRATREVPTTARPQSRKSVREIESQQRFEDGPRLAARLRDSLDATAGAFKTLPQPEEE